MIFQGMFLTKNIILKRKIKTKIRGNNAEAHIFVIFFVLFMIATMMFGFELTQFGQVTFLNYFHSTIAGIGLLVLNLIISTASLMGLKDSWRVGVIENHKTVLITSGIYGFSRNPYFVSYLLMLLAYTLLLQNLILLVLSIVGFIFTDSMVKKEEKYLYSVHGKGYVDYQKKVPRYLIV